MTNYLYILTIVNSHTNDFIKFKSKRDDIEGAVCLCINTVWVCGGFLKIILNIYLALWLSLPLGLLCHGSWCFKERSAPKKVKSRQILLWQEAWKPSIIQKEEDLDLFLALSGMKTERPRWQNFFSGHGARGRRETKMVMSSFFFVLLWKM